MQYGFVNHALELLVLRNYGPDVWEDIKWVPCGVHDQSFILFQYLKRLCVHVGCASAVLRLICINESLESMWQYVIYIREILYSWIQTEFQYKEYKGTVQDKYIGYIRKFSFTLFVIACLCYSMLSMNSEHETS